MNKKANTISDMQIAGGSNSLRGKANTISDNLTRASTLRKEANRLKIPLKSISYKDLLEIDEKLNGGFIINMKSFNEEGEGSHWTTGWIEDGNLYYFDSFGIPAPLEVENQVENYYFNPYIIQDVENGGCGSYCIEFLQAMNEFEGSPLKRYRSFIELFQGNSKLNRRVLRELEKD